MKLATKLHEGTPRERTWEVEKMGSWEKKRKKIKISVICVICGSPFFIRLRVRARYYEELL